MSEHTIRVRLKFDSTPVSYAQKCWFTFDREKCKVVRDVTHLITSHFHLHNTHGIQLYMDDYLVPTNESIQIIQDNDIIQVKTVHVPSSSESSSSSSEDEDSAERITNLQPDPKRKKITEISNKVTRPATAKLLVGVTKKMASGGLHTTFQTSSSSSSSSEDSSSEESSSSSNKQPAKEMASGGLHTTKKIQTSSSSSSSSEDSSSEESSSSSNKQPANSKAPSTQWDVKKNTPQSIIPPPRIPGGVVQSGTNSVNKASARLATGETATSQRKRRKGINIPVNGTVGGPRDVLTTKSAVYTSPLGSAHSRTILNRKNRNKTLKVGEQVTPRSDGMAENQPLPASQNDKGPNGEMEARGSKMAGGGEGARSASEVVAAAASPAAEPTRDYSSFPNLKGPPRVGDKLAFKVLELSSSYTPEVSQYMEATVVNFDHDLNAAKLKYSEDTLLHLSRKEGNLGKFSLEQDTENPPTLEVEEEVDLTVSELLEPKLIT